MTTYPKSVTLSDGTHIEIRMMTADDRDAVLEFARSLPEEDLLFLRVDLTDPDVVGEWIVNLENGDSSSLVAYDGSSLAGYATVHRTRARWTRRIGELRINVAPAYRNRGLGRLLTSEIFDVARSMSLRKLMANMIIDQRAAQAAFRRLGFTAEALLADFVDDREGHTRDLMVMTYDIEGHSDQAGDRVRI